MAQIPDNVADIVPDGDTILVLSGIIGLRVSFHALSLTSTVFKSLLFSSTSSQALPDGSTIQSVLPVLDDDGDAMYLLCNILHLRHDKLPVRIPAELLYKLAALARKYECFVAAGRATQQWFNALCTSKEPCPVWNLIEAAYLLDEATSFARLTSRWVLQQPSSTRKFPPVTNPNTQHLAAILADRQTQSQLHLRGDLDALVASVTFAFLKDMRHWIDYAPGVDVDPGESQVRCYVDSQGAEEYLGELESAKIWPSTTWCSIQTTFNKDQPTVQVEASIADIVTRLRNWREPDYNDCDKCDFCDEEGVKSRFLGRLALTRSMWADKLWGLCLDCFKAGGINAGECRYEHPKPAMANGQKK